MKSFRNPISAVVVLIVLSASSAGAWDKEEHRLLADSAYHSVMRECGRALGDSPYAYLLEGGSGLTLPGLFLSGPTFAGLSSLLTDDDLSQSRFHRRGRTVLEQLLPLTADRIAAVGRSADDSEIDFESWVRSRPLSEENVVSTYLIYHLTALHLAAQAGESQRSRAESFVDALALEAAAQGYLADAFAAGHILTPRHKTLAWMHRRNIIEVHNAYRNRGVFVVNSRGDAWQTFGDGLMLWYAPSYRKVLEAARCSLREVLAVWYNRHGMTLPDTLSRWLQSVTDGRPVDETVSSWLTERDGEDYYAELQLPTLMLLPMPVAATWSYRTETTDEHGIRRHHSYPQLKNDGLHDPDMIETDRDFLYARSAVPDWMVPPPLRHADEDAARALIRTDPDWASVLWTQDRHVPPSFKGCLVIVGGQLSLQGSDHQFGGQLGVGYGLWDDLLLIKDVSAEVAVLSGAGASDRLLLAPSFGAGLPVGFGPVKALRLEGGVAVDLRSRYADAGGLIAAGFDSKTLGLGFTYAGVMLRLKYQLLLFDRTVHGPSLQLILH